MGRPDHCGADLGDAYCTRRQRTRPLMATKDGSAVLMKMLIELSFFCREIGTKD